MKTFCYFDFEYQDAQVLMCMAQINDDIHYFDFRQSKDTEAMRDFIKSNEETIFVSYALNAEIMSLLRLGIDVTHMQCIDLMVECRMITMSHDKYFTEDSSMLGQVKALLGKTTDETKKHKDEMRDLILDNDEWTNEQWEAIALYCISDLEDLPNLLSKCREVHKSVNHPYLLPHLLQRADYVRKTTEMDYASKGFPVGQDFENIYKHKGDIKSSIIQALPTVWRLCYIQHTKTGKWTLKRNEIDEVIKKNNWNIWERTENGGPSLAIDYLKKLEVQIPFVESLRRAMQSLNTLNSTDLRSFVHEGYVKPTTFGFSAKTGRNGLKPKRGYLLNLPSWMRKSVHPHKGYVMIGSDYGQQEIAVAARLSGDKQLEKAYASGDVYLALGRANGMIPEDGTKKSHQKERDMFKVLQLGMAYGKGVKSISLDFYNLLKDDGWTQREAALQAQDIYKWHKRHFNIYWSWIEKQVRQAIVNGWTETSDGWVCFASKKTRKTALLNFPSQAGGAVMIRIATLKAYDFWQAGLLDPVLCSQHDSIYINSTDDNLADKVMILEDALKQASKDQIGIEIRVDTKTFTHDTGYVPDKWTPNDQKIWDMVLASALKEEEEQW